MTGQGLRLRPVERIRRRPEFERAYSAGRKVHGRLMTVFVLPNGREHSRLGVAATRKIGSAVTRNRAKRMAREVFRLHKVAPGFDIIVVPRREMLDAPFTSIEADYLTALERGRTINTVPPAGPRRRGSRPGAHQRL